jgi:hypothetical protein
METVMSNEAVAVLSPGSGYEPKATYQAKKVAMTTNKLESSSKLMNFVLMLVIIFFIKTNSSNVVV